MPLCSCAGIIINAPGIGGCSNPSLKRMLCTLVTKWQPRDAFNIRYLPFVTTQLAHIWMQLEMTQAHANKLIPDQPGLEDCCYPHEVNKDSSAVNT